MLIYAFYRKRPFKRFTSASDIPKHFITERVVQRGVVSKIQPTENSGPVLMVKHQPPVSLPFGSGKLLPVKVRIFELKNSIRFFFIDSKFYFIFFF